jgi:predicted RNA-binding Zn-ribbon protein involved in translation (DUF1610 family)
MSDFVTLICPACGGKLDISPSTASLVCQFCGAEHIVRREAGNILLESFAQCPICHRNDKARKVSGIVSSHTVNMNGVTIEKRHYTDKDGRSYTTTERVPFTGSQASDLARRLAPPPKPTGTNSGCGTTILFGVAVYLVGAVAISMLCTVIYYGGIVIGFIASWILSLFGANESTRGVVAFILMGIFALILIGVTLVIGGNFVVKQWKKNALIKAENDKKEQERLARETVLWNKAMEKWGRLYYCERDDIVFDPTSNLHVPTMDILKFVYRND